VKQSHQESERLQIDMCLSPSHLETHRHVALRESITRTRLFTYLERLPFPRGGVQSLFGLAGRRSWRSNRRRPPHDSTAVCLQYLFRNPECRHFGGLQNQALDQREGKFTNCEISFHFCVHASHRRWGDLPQFVVSADAKWTTLNHSQR
jgi:hypothetical protein